VDIYGLRRAGSVVGGIGGFRGHCFLGGVLRVGGLAFFGERV
jgi:hypothetical protein